MCERLLADHALKRPVFGWGGFGRGRVTFTEENKNEAPTDGLWIITLGAKGFVGLVLNYLILGLPIALFLRRFPAKSWTNPRVGMAALAAVLLGVYIIDCLLNAFVNIIYITLAGGLIGLDPRQIRGPTVPAPTEAARPARPASQPAVATRSQQADRCRALGRSARRQGRLEEADAAWRRALELLAEQVAADPGAEGPRRAWCDCANDLGWLWANHPDPSRRDPDAAVALARRAVDEYPDAAAYWNTLGAACFRAGDDRGAIVALERSASLGGGTAFDDVFLAMALSRTGDPEGARRAMARALVRAERDYPGHRELAALYDEAHASIDGGTTTPAVV